MATHLEERLSPQNRARILGTSFVSAAMIATADRFLFPELSLGLLYFFPLLVSATLLNRWQVLLASIAAALLREQFSPGAWTGNALPRVFLSVVAFGGAGLFITEMARGRRLQAQTLARLAEQDELLRASAQEAQHVIESSPAAIITVARTGRIELLNSAARRVLGLGDSEPKTIEHYLPAIGKLLRCERTVALMRTMVEGSGRREGGEGFYAEMWISSYQTPAGIKLAIVLADISEQFRDREELGLRQLLMHSRIIAGAVSHEVRNLAAAAQTLHESIRVSQGDAACPDFVALGRVVEAMRKLVAPDNARDAEQELTGVDLNALLGELRIVIASSVDAAGIQLRWEIADNLPRVRADRAGLLQVFLNLSQNSIHALQGRPDGVFTVAAYCQSDTVVVRLADNGPGLRSTESLFQPFQPGSTSTGLGLYVSRAITRTYGGELHYIKSAKEWCFLVELPALAYLERAVNA